MSTDVFSDSRNVLEEAGMWLFSKLNNVVTFFGYLAGLGSNPGEDMDVCKRIVSLRHGGTLNSRRAASPLVEEGGWGRELGPLTLPQGVLPQNWGGTELNRTVTGMVLKAMANDRRTSSSLS
ncbi:uncharacterized protein TNCV_3008661 [Trichonephila clavipes]|nr:uncharacterized protein TNCV_3008661 [Trichonephila clavipes]